MSSRNWNRLWVTGTVLLISFISFSSQYGVIWPWHGRSSSVELWQLLVPFNILVFMVFWNYYLCVTTPPGSVPKGWRPKMDQLEGMEVKRGSHAPRYCKKCEHYKPPRTHHCRQCNACVLKVGLAHNPLFTMLTTISTTCSLIITVRGLRTRPTLQIELWLIVLGVGFRNQGHFLRFLLWVDLATTYHLVMMVKRVSTMVPNWAPEPTLADVLFIVFNFAACVPVWLCVGMFSMYHLYLAAGNTTTIERWEKDKVATLVRRGKISEIKYPYSLGAFRNVQAVLGRNPLFWLIPQTMQGDGLSFTVNPSAGDADAQYAWPPQDPSRLPNPPPPDSSASAFVYGQEQLNPALRPSNSTLRTRLHSDSTENGTKVGDGWASGSDESKSSSPERYLSDYDDDAWGPRDAEEDQEEKLRRLEGRVRRGSEGWEIRPGAAWDQSPREWGAPGPAWLEQGRYNVYESSAHDVGDDSDD